MVIQVFVDHLDGQRGVFVAFSCAWYSLLDFSHDVLLSVLSYGEIGAKILESSRLSPDYTFYKG